MEKFRGFSSSQHLPQHKSYGSNVGLLISAGILFEIEKPDFGVGCDQDVFRSNVAMDDALLMRIAQLKTNTDPDEDDLLHRNRPFRDPSGKRFSHDRRNRLGFPDELQPGGV